jgi:primosomal protein N' (replication factor Y)
MTIIRVALDVPLPRLFDYVAAQATTKDIGRLVEVRFGRGARLGVIVAVSDASEYAADKLKPAGTIRSDLPVMPNEWLQLCEFCAGYYQHPLGEVMTLALPPMLRRGRLPARRKAKLPAPLEACAAPPANPEQQAAAFCSTASPAVARPRFTCRRSPRPSRKVGRR